MNWLTKEEIKNRALQGAVFALDVSSEHWKQLAEATEEELYDGIANSKVDIYSDSCGCCIYNGDDCSDCLIREVCNEFYLKANRHFVRFLISRERKHLKMFKMRAKQMLKGINKQLLNYRK